jgi:hypothetical protein
MIPQSVQKILGFIFLLFAIGTTSIKPILYIFKGLI